MQNGLMILEIFGQHTSLYFKTSSSRQLASYVSCPDRATRSTLAKVNGLEVQNWLDRDKTSPGSTYVASAPISFTMIGLINLADFYIMCKAANMTPSDAVAAMQVVTGHSQGTMVAACIARANSWEGFCEAA